MNQQQAQAQGHALAQAAITKSESMVLLKNMIRISVSSICYFRDLFPKHCFRNKDYGTVPIHQLQGATREEDGSVSVLHEEAFLLTQWLEKGVFKALESEYLHSVSFAIYTKHPVSQEDLLLEIYEFKLGYQTSTDGEAQPPRLNDVPLHSKDAVKNQAGRFIRSLAEFTGTLDNIPEERWITLQLKYEEHTPVDYEPDFFQAADRSIFFGEHLPLVIKVGGLATPDLTMQLRFAGLESLLFEDLCKAGAEGGTSGSGSTKGRSDGSVLRASSMPHQTAAAAASGGSSGQPHTPTGAAAVAAAAAVAEQQQATAGTVYAQVKEHIMRTGKAQAKQVSKEMVVPDIQLKAVFADLVKNGIIKCKGKGFTLTSAAQQERQVYLQQQQQLQHHQQQGLALPIDEAETEEAVIADSTPCIDGGAERQLLLTGPPHAPRKSRSPGVGAAVTPAISKGGSSSRTGSRRAAAAAASHRLELDCSEEETQQLLEQQQQEPIIDDIIQSGSGEPWGRNSYSFGGLGTGASFIPETADLDMRGAGGGGGGGVRRPLALSSKAGSGASRKRRGQQQQQQEQQQAAAEESQSQQQAMPLSQSLSLSQCSEVSDFRPAGKRRKYSVIKDPINHRDSAGPTPAVSSAFSSSSAFLRQ